MGNTNGSNKISKEKLKFNDDPEMQADDESEQNLGSNNGMILRSKSKSSSKNKSDVKEQMDDLKGSKAKSIKSSNSGKVSKLSSETKNSPKEKSPGGTETIVLGNKTTRLNRNSKIMGNS